MVPTILLLRIVFITAMINIVSLLLVLFSCRCINLWKVTRGLSRYTWFKKYFKWHCWFWYVFIPSVIVHAILAIYVMGVPF